MNRVRILMAVGICILVMHVFLPGHTSAAENALPEGSEWLFSNQNADGSWGADKTRETATVVEVLGGLAETGSPYTRGIHYLQSAGTDCTDHLSRKIVSLAGAGQLSQSDVDLLLSLQNPDGGFGFAANYPSTVVDSLLAAQALAKAGVTDQQVIGRLLGYITQYQKYDGSFSFTFAIMEIEGRTYIFEPGDGNLYLTAYAVQVLSSFVSPYANLKPYIDNAVAYLYTYKQDDGGFVSTDASPVITTALAARALVAAGGDAATIPGARTYLLENQMGNGGWEDDPVATALALGALASMALPNLAIDSSSIQLTPSIPASGQMVRISATVSSTGVLGVAMTTKAKFYLGAATVGSGGVPLGDADIGPLPAGSSQQVSWYGQLPLMAGNKKVYVVANEDSAHFAETTYADNIASRQFFMSTAPDLAISADDIAFSNNSPLRNESFDVVAYIHNPGETGIGSVHVALYDGNPAAGGQELLRLTIPDIEGGNYGLATFNIFLPAGEHDLYVWVDPDGVLTEASKINNRASKPITVSGAIPVAGIDLLVLSSEITFSNPYPRQGDQFVITSMIRNIGSTAAHNAPVSIYAVNSKGARTQLSNPTVDVGGDNAFEFVLKNVTLPAETYQITVYADDGNTIAEADENNNEGYQSLTVLKASGGTDRIDIEASADFIMFDPAQPVLGDNVAIKCGVLNAGTIALNNVKVKIYAGMPGAGGALMIPEVTAPQLAVGRTAWITVERNTSGWGGEHEIYVVATLTDGIIEDNTGNNQASKILTVTVPGSRVDFAVDNTSIHIEPVAPVAGDNMSITVRVENSGTVEAAAALALYNGDPRGQAELVALTPAESVPAGGSVELTFAPIDAGLFAAAQSLCVAVIPAQGVIEIDDDNNIACIPNVVQAPDLVFKNNGIATMPPAPVSGEQFTVQAIVQNAGSAAADGIQVAIYDENPASGSAPLAAAEIPHIGPGEEGMAELPLTLAAGSYGLYLVADPLYVVDGIPYNRIPESHEENNSASIIVDVAASSCTISIFYRDADNDSYGNPARTTQACEAPAGYSSNSDDCNDSDPAVHQEGITRSCTGPCGQGTQTCTGGDWQECVSSILPQTFYRDADNDSYGNPARTTQACEAPAGYVINSDDCNDSDPAVHQEGATRSCGPCSDGTQTCAGGFWQECNAANTITTFYRDADNDSYGNPAQSVQACEAPAGYSSNSDDCNDSDPAINPGAAEIPYNGTDDDCNPFTRDNSSQYLCGKDAAMQKGAQWLKNNQSQKGGWPTHYSLLNNALVLQLLALTNTNNTEKDNLKQRIYETQATNGSWAGVQETAYTIIALMDAGESPESPVIIDAVNRLIEVRTASNGSWGNTIPDTSLAIIALVAAGVDRDSDYVQAGKNWLINVRARDYTGSIYWGVMPGDPILTRGALWYPVEALLLGDTLKNPVDPNIINALVRTFIYTPNAEFNSLYAASLTLTYYTGIRFEYWSCTPEYIKTRLKNNQQPSGAWSNIYRDESAPEVFNTAEAAIALWRMNDRSDNITKAINYCLSKVTNEGDYPPIGDNAASSAEAALALQYSYPDGFVSEKQRVITRFIETQSRGYYECGFYPGSWYYTLMTTESQWTGSITPAPPIIEALSSLTVDYPGTGKTDAISKARTFLRNTSYAPEYAWPGQENLEPDVYTTSRAIIALLASGGLPTDHSPIPWLISKRQNGNWGGDTPQAVIALWKAGYPNETHEAIQWLKATQKTDGGWGSVGGTSWVLITLSQVGEFGREMQKGVAYLLSMQNSDGGWASIPGIPASNTSDTALATRALAVSECQNDIGLNLAFDKSEYFPGDTVQITATPVDLPASALTVSGSVTESDGSPYPVTFIRSCNEFIGTHILSGNHTQGTDVVSVLAESGVYTGAVAGAFTVRNPEAYLPDLAITSDKISFSPETFGEGYPVTITAHVANIGLRDAENVKVACYDGDPATGGSLIGEATIGLVSMNGSVDVPFAWEAKRGTHEIHVVIDPENAIRDISLSNNHAYRAARAFDPDLAITDDAISFSPATLREGYPVTITAYITNIGLRDAADAPVACYDGDPETGGILIGEATLGLLSVNGRVWLPFAWQPNRGMHEIHVVIDPDNVTREISRANNHAYRAVLVLDPDPDLAITSDKISFSSNAFREGEPVTITAQVANIGLGDAVTVPVACYDGDPARGGSLLGERTLGRVSANGSVAVPFAWRADGNIHEIHVVIDPDNVIQETNNANNHAYRLTLPAEPDLAVDADDIVLAPQAPPGGQPVTITVTVHNLGQQAGAVAVRFLDGATRLCPNQTIPVIRAGGSKTLTVTWDRTNPPGRHYIHVIVDPENSIPEAQENNNEAITAIDIGAGSHSIPNLSIADSDITFSPANPLEGDSVTISATVTNWGASADNIPMQFYDGYYGDFIGERIIYERLDFGESTTVSMPWDTTGKKGDHDIYVYVNSWYADENWQDNTAQAILHVGASGLSVAVDSDRDSYNDNDSVAITATITNENAEPREIVFELLVLDAAGATVAQLVQHEMLFVGSGELVLPPATWSTGGMPAGDYIITAQVSDNGTGAVRAIGRRQITITAGLGIAATVTTDRALYAAHEQVRITAAVRSLSPNSTFDNLRAGLRIVDAVGAELFSDEKAIDSLPALQTLQWAAGWNTRTNAPGPCRLLLSVVHDGMTVAADNATISILSGQQAGKTLQGDVSITPAQVHAGGQVELAWQVTNAGNAGLDNVTMTLAIMRVADQSIAVELTDMCSIDTGRSCNGARVFVATGLVPGDYAVILSGTVDSISQAIAFASFAIVDQCPVADAGNDQPALIDQAVYLDGSASSDPDNDTINYRWALVEQPQGGFAQLSDATSAVCSFTPGRHGQYVLELVVSDGNCDSPADRAIVTTENRPPVAGAGADQLGHVGDTITLNGSGSYDPDNDTITQWEWVVAAQPTGRAAQLTTPDARTTAFTIVKKGEYRISLRVFDGLAWSTADEAVITAVNRCPVADAGDDLSAQAGQAVTLDGSGSFDPDNDSLIYSWALSAPQGSMAQLANPATAHPAFTPDKPGIYTATLIVSDGMCSSSEDSVFITVADDTPLPDCSDIPVPAPPCAMKTDYGAGGVGSDYVKVSSYKEYQNYEASNYGYKNGKYKKLKIAGSITMQGGDLVLHSPAVIEIGKSIKLKAPAGVICLDGRMGVTTDQVYLEAEQVALMSQSGDVSLGKYSQVHADGLYVSAGGSGNFEDHVLVTVDGPVTLLSTGFASTGAVAVKQAVAVISSGLVMRGMGTVQVSEFADLEIAGPVRMVSTGSGTGSQVWVKYGAVVKAESVCISGPEEVSVGPGSIIDAGTVSVLSTGGKAASKADIKPVTLISAHDMSLSGEKAWLEPFSLLLIHGKFTMNAAAISGCSVKGCYRAGSKAGNCLE